MIVCFFEFVYLFVDFHNTGGKMDGESMMAFMKEMKNICLHLFVCLICLFDLFAYLFADFHNSQEERWMESQ